MAFYKRGRQESAHVKSLILFLRDCYESDNRESAFNNLFSADVQHLCFPIMGSDFLSGAIDRIPIDRDMALQIKKDADLYRTERSLVMGVFVLAGKPRDKSRGHLFAPLFMAPAEIVDAPPYAFIHADIYEFRLNTRALTRLADEDCQTGVDELVSGLPELTLPFDRLDVLVTKLCRVLPDLDAQAMSRYPALIEEDAIKCAAKNIGAAPQLLPVVCLALIPNSPDTREVLSELATLGETAELSPPLHALFGSKKQEKLHRGRPIMPLPTSLSHPQQAVISCAGTQPLTVIVGPPGTGKSFTIAALALEHAARGESVLIAAKTEQAIEVVRSKIEELAKGDIFLVCGGRGARAKQLKTSIDRLLQGMGGTSNVASDPLMEEYLWRIDHITARVKRLERVLARRIRLEQKWGEWYGRGGKDRSLKALFNRMKFHFLERRLARGDHLWEISESLLANNEELHYTVTLHLSRNLRQHLAYVLENHRSQLVSLARALRARTKRKLAEYFTKIDRKVLLSAFPIWLTTLADVGDLVPLQPWFFDLAVIDEATQCDMAAALPVLYRSRRATVTGDPRQLRHVSFLSEDRLAQTAERWQLEETELETFHYRKKSLLDLVIEAVATQKQVIFLDEHFRSRPPIIDFSNREFYQGRLKIMTRRPATERAESIVLRRVAGMRDRRGINKPEAEQVLAELGRIIESEAALPAGVCSTLGVLSPFRDQVDHMVARISRRIDAAAIEKHRLLVGTAHSFQGEEKDIMLLSLVVDGNAHASSFQFLTKPDVFNVSITRARQLQIIVTSLPEDARLPAMLARYFQHIQSKSAAHAPARVQDTFLDEVRSALQDHGCATWPCYVVAGREVDLIVERGGTTLGIDLIGHPGMSEGVLGSDDLCLLKRAGLRLFSLPFSAWCLERDACLEEIEAWFSRPG